MKQVFSHPAQVIAAQIQAALEQADIKSVLRNEFASGAAGELAPIDAWVEVWVLRDRDFDRASEVVAAMQQAVTEEEWECAKCNNANPATFDSCWSCAAVRL